MWGQVLKKYFQLYLSFFKASFVADLEFRVNFSTRIITDIFWYAAHIATFEVLFLHTPLIGHWNLSQTRVFLGIMFVVDAIYMTILHDNLDRLSEKVRKGDLDLLLVKPVNSQFMVSFQRVATASLGNLIMAAGWLAWSLWRLPEWNWIRLFWLLILIPCGFCILYSMRFLFSAVSVIFTRSENIQFIWYQLYKVGTRPDSLYNPWVRYVILSIIPVGLIASIPARSILDPPHWGLFLWTILMAPLCIYVSHRFWNFCLKYYSSASS